MDYPDIAVHKAQNDYPLIGDIKELAPPKTKTSSLEAMAMIINVRYSHEIGFFQYQLCESNKLPKSIQREWHKEALIKKNKGTNCTYHRIGKEMAFVLEGSILAWCEDLSGEQRTYHLDGSSGLYIPPFVAHHYHAKEKSRLLLISDIAFELEGVSYDTYPSKAYKNLQKRMGKK